MKFVYSTSGGPTSRLARMVMSRCGCSEVFKHDPEMLKRQGFADWKSAKLHVHETGSEDTEFNSGHFHGLKGDPPEIVCITGSARAPDLSQGI